MGISIYQLLIILAIVVLVFGTKRVKQLGQDIGSGIRSFKKNVKELDSSISEVKKDE